MYPDIQKWNQRHQSGRITAPEPSIVLKENGHLLPKQGDALDFACGQGGNALYLAKSGMSVHAWDFSTVAIDFVKQHAIRDKLLINTEVRDISKAPPIPNSFDVIVVSHFLDRKITSNLIDALKPDGLLFYQTFTRNKTPNVGPGNPDYLLKENELLDLFRELHLRVYREEALWGDTKKGLRNEALLVGQKPALF